MTTIDRVSVDPITTEIVRNAFIAAAQDMNANLIRSAHSPIIYEMKDCSVGIFDRETNLLGQAAGLPIFLGNLEVTIQITIEKYGYDGINDGDVFILNDSYMTGTHLGDITVISPIFYAGELVGFTASRAHWLDIGAKDTMPVDSTEIYQEGIRLPPTRIIAGGVPDHDLIDILKLNSRLPLILEGDLNAQIAAARTGEARYQAILDRFGRETVEAAAQQIFAQASELDRQVVAAMPDGVYTAEGFLDDDGVSDDPVHVKLTVTIENDRMTMDLTGSNPRVRGNVNCGRAQSISGCRVAFKTLVNPDVPVTGGTFAPLDVIVEDGTIFAAENPAACQFYFSPLGLLIDLLGTALAPVIPDRVAAATSGIRWSFRCSSPAKPSRSTQRRTLAVGEAAKESMARALINNVNGGLKSIPVEVSESVFPVKIAQYALRIDSGGAGKWRGGHGIVREYVMLEDDTRFTVRLDRAKMPGWGLLGGESAEPPKATFVYPDGSNEIRNKVNAHSLPAGTRVVVETGGGGGFGDPSERSRTAIEHDLHEGFISPNEATGRYGYSA
ncbi:MAG: hydantoinase B/oxoprolinase family protein [Thermomicrobiales bacterium]